MSSWSRRQGRAQAAARGAASGGRKSAEQGGARPSRGEAESGNPELQARAQGQRALRKPQFNNIAPTLSTLVVWCLQAPHQGRRVTSSAKVPRRSCSALPLGLPPLSLPSPRASCPSRPRSSARCARPKLARLNARTATARGRYTRHQPSANNMGHRARRLVDEATARQAGLVGG